MLAADISVGGDPIVHPADFRITTFASGLNYPHGLQALPDGSMLVAVNNPNNGGANIFDSTGALLRFVDANGDGVADGAGKVLFDGLPGPVTAVKQVGHFIAVTSSPAGGEKISFLRVGSTPAAPLKLVGSINFNFGDPSWEHTTFALATRPTPGQPGNYDLFFNIGSQLNGVVIGSNGQVTLDANGNPIPQPTLGTVQATGLLSATLNGDAIHMVTVRDVRGTPRLVNLRQVASGLRNAASMSVDPKTGDLWLADNGIDGNEGSNAAWSTDELDKVPAAEIGKVVQNFGFPYSYVKTVDHPGDPVTVVNPTFGVQPVIAFQPIPDAAGTPAGSQSEGASGFALSPSGFPVGLNQGVFIGFHGKFNQGGTDNEENPLVFANPITGHYFDFISNDLTNIGHLDELFSTSDSLFVADLSSSGDLFSPTGVGDGKIYQIKAIPQPSIVARAAAIAPVSSAKKTPVAPKLNTSGIILPVVPGTVPPAKSQPVAVRIAPVPPKVVRSNVSTQVKDRLPRQGTTDTDLP
ncbi:hypothetical protein EP7_001223 [Isosphaeraceae bacterium EP7]